MSYATITDWLCVGNRESCRAERIAVHQGKRFELRNCVHIFRSDKPDNSCDFIIGGRFTNGFYSYDLCMNYKDGDLIDESNLANLTAAAAKIKAMAPEHRGTLVHCHAGMCRSPTVAAFLLAMVDDSVHPVDAFWMVERAIYDQLEKHDGGKVCNSVHQPKRQVIRLIEEARR